jgi:hypothetical protein
VLKVNQVNVKIDFNEVVGKIKPLHAVNDVPSATFAYNGAEEGVSFLEDAGVPYCRLHDLSGRYGSNVFVDVSNIFRNFDADENDPENYDFIFTDKLLELLDKHGIKPFYRLGETIENDFLIKADKLIKVKPNSIKEVGITDKFIFIQTDEDILYALPTADSQFLDTDSVIAQTTSDNTVEVNFDDNLTSCLDRLSAVADGKTQPKITIKKTKAVCSYLNENVKFKETIRTDYEEDDDISFSFNPQTLKKALLNSKTYITVIPNSNSKIIKFISDNKLYILYMA